MDESVAQSSTTSASSAAKQRGSKRSVRADLSHASSPRKPAFRGRLQFQPLFAELARLAELSSVERSLREFGFRVIAGTDEVGRGCLAGPVVAGAVILDGDVSILGVNDSKVLSRDDRLAIARNIMSRARAVAIGVVEPHTIDKINILEASKLAMRQAVETLDARPEILLVDAVTLDTLAMPQIPLIQGDRRTVSIGAASIIAKVYRDLLMESYHEVFPQYDFIHNRGYGTENHWTALARLGPTPIHRLSFMGVKERTLFD